jgi:hypothetical protein
MLLAATTAAAGQQRQRLAKFTLFVWKAVVVVYSDSSINDAFLFFRDVLFHINQPRVSDNDLNLHLSNDTFIDNNDIHRTVMIHCFANKRKMVVS